MTETVEIVPFPCPRCEELTEPGDHYEIDDGSAYHIGCYQASMIEGGQPDPFPLCDYCEQLIYETEPVEKGEVCEQQPDKVYRWRPALFHPDCAPGATSEAPNRVDHPPSQLSSLERPMSPLNPISGQVTQAAVDQLPQLGAPCADCGKPVQRSIIIFNHEAYHGTCLTKMKKRAVKGATQEPSRCYVCHKNINPKVLQDESKFVEWDDNGKTERAHRACYRKALLLDGQPDPYPEDGPVRGLPKIGAVPGETKDNPAIPCGICENLGRPGVKILRNDYRQHVADHEAAQWSA